MQTGPQPDRSNTTDERATTGAATAQISAESHHVEAAHAESEPKPHRHPMLLAGGLIAMIAVLRSALGRLVLGVLGGGILLEKISRWIWLPTLARRRDAEAEVVVRESASERAAPESVEPLSRERHLQHAKPPPASEPMAVAAEAAPPGEPPPLDEEPGSGSGGSEPPKPRRINAWISETKDAPETRLDVGATYTLNFNVGTPLAATLVPGHVREISPDEVPEHGLDTQWIVTSRRVRFSPAPDESDVTVAHPDGPDSSLATFSLRIPHAGDSETRRLMITPTSADRDDAELDVIILARGTLFRQFRVELNMLQVALATPDERVASATVTGDVEHTQPGYTGLLPQHEWQTPPGKLTISVTGAGKATFSGEVWNAQSGFGYVNNFTDWITSGPATAGPIRNVQDAADKLRRTFSSELNDVDQGDLTTRLTDFRRSPGTFWDLTRADAAHEQAWSRIAASDEMLQLASAGYTLYRTFFPDGSKLRPLLDELPQDWRIDLYWGKQIDPNWVAHVPWTLMYLRPPEPGEPIDAMNFLGLRYRIGYFAHYSDRSPSPALGGLSGTACAYGLYWGDDDPELVQEVAWQQAQWKVWGNPVFVPDSNLALSRKMQVLAMFNKAPAQPTPMLYCYCHCDLGDGNKPVLRFGKTPTPDDNVRLYDLVDKPLAYAPIVFINACGSAASDPYVANALAENFFDRGCRAYLGPIVKIPVRFASRFAKVFYSFFLRDLAPEPVAAGEAVFQARRFLWREYRNIGGLFYSYMNMYEAYMATEAEVRALQRHN